MGTRGPVGKQNIETYVDTNPLDLKWGNASSKWNAEVKKVWADKKASPEAVMYTPFMISDFKVYLNMLSHFYSHMVEMDQRDITSMYKTLITHGEKHISNPTTAIRLDLRAKEVEVKIDKTIMARKLDEMMHGNANSPEVYVYEEEVDDDE